MFPFIAVHTARRLFILVCLLPTLCVVSWAVAHALPGNASRASRDLSRALRLQAEVAQCTALRPGESSYATLRLLDPVTHEKLLIVTDALTVSQVGSRRDLRAPRMEVQLLALPRLIHWFQSHVYDSVSRTVGEFQLQVDSVELHHGDVKWPVGSLSAKVSVGTAQSHFDVVLCTAEDTLQRSTYVKIDGIYQHGSPRPSCKIEVDLRHIPLTWVTPFWGFADQFGANAQWQSGKLTWDSEYQETGVATVRESTFTDVDLNYVSMNWLDAPLQGTAHVAIASWELHPQQVHAGTATVECPDGVLDPFWIEYLKSEGRPSAVSHRPSRPFTELKVEVRYERARWSMGPVRSASSPGDLLPILRDENAASTAALRQSLPLAVRRR